MYRPFSTFWAVPVLPPTLYPSIYEVRPLPLATTFSRASLTFLLVSSLMTCLTLVGLVSLMTVFVSGSLILLTIYGLYNVPPLIAALTAVTCCIAF